MRNAIGKYAMRVTTMEERGLIADSLERLLHRHGDRGASGVGGFAKPSEDLWAEFAQLGLLGACLS